MQDLTSPFKPLFMRALLMVLALCASAAVRAGEGIHLVVGAKSPVTSLTQREVVALFTGRVRAFPGGEAARPLDYGRQSEQRQAFYMALAGMDLAQINSYWARLHFTGQVQPPRAVADEAEMISLLQKDPQAIGYLTHKPSDAGLRSVLVLP